MMRLMAGMGIPHDYTWVQPHWLDIGPFKPLIHHADGAPYCAVKFH